MVYIVGNKTDLAARRETTREMGEDFARSLHMTYFETSDKDDKGINELFNDMNKQLIARNVPRRTPAIPSLPAVPLEAPEKTGCC